MKDDYNIRHGALQLLSTKIARAQKLKNNAAIGFASIIPIM